MAYELTDSVMGEERRRREEATGTLIQVPIEDRSGPFDEAREDFRCAAALAGHGMLLRRSRHSKGLTWKAIEEIAGGSVGRDPNAHRAELLDLVKRTQALAT